MSTGNTTTLTITTPPGAESDTVASAQMNHKLPLELYSYIFDYINDISTLLSLLVSSKSAHSQAERKLYRNIKLSKPTSHKLFLESILDPKRPHLAHLVYRYSLSDALVGKKFNTLLTRALVMFANLRYLSFRDVSGPPSARVLPIGTSCPFQLHTFHWFGGTHTPRLGAFLDSQQSLEVLCLFVGNVSFSVSPISLQRLRTLSGSTKLITKIMPGRSNITCLEWSFPSWLIPPINASLIPSLSHIRHLSFGTQDARPSLGTVIPLLKHLEVLEVGLIHAKELVDLYKLVYLRILVISGNTRGFGFPVRPPDIFNHMKSLERIYLRHITCVRPSPPYKRWVRGAQEPKYAGFYEVAWWKEIREI